jgi:hypothetical protein
MHIPDYYSSRFWNAEDLSAPLPGNRPKTEQHSKWNISARAKERTTRVMKELKADQVLNEIKYKLKHLYRRPLINGL